MSWYSKTTSWSMYWHMWPPIKLPKLSPGSCIRVTSWSLEPQPGSWVIGVLTSWAVSSMKCARSSAWRNYGPCLTIHRLMGWFERTHQTIMRILGSWVKTKRPTGQDAWFEIVHAYNATHSTMTMYIPHYLMFGWRHRLPVNFTSHL